MFDNSSVMVMCKFDKGIEIYKIDLNEETRTMICHSFAEAQESMFSDKEKVFFDGSYKPNSDEFMSIEKYSLNDKIKDAIRDPIGQKSYQKLGSCFPEIHAIFVGEREEIGNNERFIVAFQRFKRDQYISNRSIRLFHNGETFLKDNRFGISISDSIDCFYHGNELQFVSYYLARQVFDLCSYYRLATDQEVRRFTSINILNFVDPVTFGKMADTWIRRKIAIINDSKVLETCPVNKIKSLAEAVGVRIDILDRKIIIPADKKTVKVILGFFDEEAYLGPFSRKTYLANSKRQITI